jgi:subtilisin family serine protease
VKVAPARRAIPLLAATLLALPAGAAGQDDGDKKIVRSQDDMPRHTYEIDYIPSELFASREAFMPFAERVAADAREVLATYEIEDKATLRSLYSLLEDLALLNGDFDEALVYGDKIRELEEKPAAKLMSGLVVHAIAYAAKAAPEGDPARNAAFRTDYSAAVGELPWDVVQDDVEAMKGSMEIIGENLFLGIIQNQMDPAVERTGNVSGDMAEGLIGMRTAVDVVLPYREQIVGVLQAYIETNRIEKLDIWAARSVDLSANADAQPVLVAIWDTGVDPDVYGDQMFRNPAEQLDGVDNDANGFVDDVHGIAFEWDGTKTTGALYPLAETARARLPQMTQQIKGLNDLQAGIDSPESQALKRQMSGMKPDEVKPFIEELGLFSIYTHGTHVAGIAVEENPGAHVLVVRQAFPYEMIPPPMFKEDAERWVANMTDIMAYLSGYGVRVVNMSWGFSPPELEGMFEVNGIGSDSEERKAMAREVFDIMITGMERAFSSAPEGRRGDKLYQLWPDRGRALERLRGRELHPGRGAPALLRHLDGGAKRREPRGEADRPRPIAHACRGHRPHRGGSRGKRGWSAATDQSETICRAADGAPERRHGVAEGNDERRSAASAALRHLRAGIDHAVRGGRRSRGHGDIPLRKKKADALAHPYAYQLIAHQRRKELHAVSQQ